MIRPTLIILGGVLLGSLLITPATSLAQERGATGGPAGARRETLLGREADLEKRQITLDLLSEPGKTRVLTEDDRKFIANQIFEDFERVQVVNQEMIQATSKLDSNGCKRISSLADELNKRAKRLKTNLGIPDLKQEEKQPEPQLAIDAAELKISLQTLTGTVRNFVNSPVFKDPRVTTVGHLQNLRRDIVTVIDLSTTVKKSASKLQSQN